MNATTLDTRRGPMPWWTLLLALCAVLLAACSNSSDAPPPVAPAAPVIQAQPSDQSTTVGGNANFSVTASAAGAVVTVQWQVLNGNVWADIAGATAPTLTITGATPTQNGTQYRAVVSANAHNKKHVCSTWRRGPPRDGIERRAVWTGGCMTAPLPAVQDFDEDAWDDLLNYIEERRVIPIVGPDLLRVQTDRGLRPLYEWLAEKLGPGCRSIPSDCPSRSR